MQRKNEISQITTVVRERIEESFSKEVIGIKEIKMEQNEQKSVATALKADSDVSPQSSNEVVTQITEKITKHPENSPDESAEKIINIKKLITTDSKGLEEKFVGEVISMSMITDKVQSKVPLSNEQKTKVTQSIGESEVVYESI